LQSGLDGSPACQGNVGTGCLIDEIRRRGVEGWDEPAFYTIGA